VKPSAKYTEVVNSYWFLLIEAGAMPMNLVNFFLRITIVSFFIILFSCVSPTQKNDTIPTPKTMYLLSKRTVFNSDGKTIGFFVIYDYDVNGNNIKQTYFNPDSLIVRNYTRFEYDLKGNMIKESYPASTTNDGKLSAERWITYTYDDKGHNIGSVSFDTTGTQVWHVVLNYNEKGNRILYSGFNKDSVLDNMTKYEYNSSNLLIKRTGYFGDSAIAHFETFEYNASGLLIRTDYFSDTISGPQYTRFLKYDSLNRKCLETYQQSAGSAIYYKYAYDVNSNLIVDSANHGNGYAIMTQYNYKVTSKTKHAISYTVTYFGASKIICHHNIDDLTLPELSLLLHKKCL